MRGVLGYFSFTIRGLRSGSGSYKCVGRSVTLFLGSHFYLFRNAFQGCRARLGLNSATDGFLRVDHSTTELVVGGSECRLFGGTSKSTC